MGSNEEALSLDKEAKEKINQLNVKINIQNK